MNTHGESGQPAGLAPDLTMPARNAVEPTWMFQSQLRDLAERYALAVDVHDGASVAALFSDSGSITSPPWRPDDDGREPSVVVGRPAIQDLIHGLNAPGGPHSLGPTFHAIVGFAASVGGRQATGVTRCIAHHVSVTEAGAYNDVLHLAYDDVFTRDSEDGLWLFESRTLRPSFSERRPIASDAVAKIDIGA